MSARDSSDGDGWDKPSDEDLPAVSSTPHPSFGITATPRDRPIFRQSNTLRYEGLPAETRAAAARLASDRSLTPPVRKDRRPEVVLTNAQPYDNEDPALVIEALNPHLAWLAEDRRPTLNAHVLRGDLDAALAMLREELRRYPKNLSIARSVQVVERALIARLNHKLEPHDRVLSIVRPLVKVRETADSRKILDMVDGAATLEDVIRRSPLKRLETLVSISDLVTRGVLAMPSPLAVRARRDPRVEDSNPGRMQKPAPNPVRMARLAKQLGMDIREEEGPDGERSNDERHHGGSRPTAFDDEVAYDDGNRETLSDPIETEVRAALTRSELRTKPPPAGPPISREEPDEPSEIRVESIRPARAVSIEPPPHEERASKRSGEPDAPATDAPVTVRGAATPELLEAASGKRSKDAPSASQGELPKPEPEPPATSSVDDVRTDKPPSVRPSKHGPKAPSFAPAVIVDDGDRPRPLPAYAKPAIIGACACALLGAVYFAMSGEPAPAPLASASSKPAATSTPTPTPSTTTATSKPTVDTSVPASPTIKLHIEITPEYAKVSLDGRKLKAPFDGTLPRDGAKHVLKIDAPGHKQKKIEITASADTNLVIALEPLPKPSKTVEPIEPAPSAPTPDPYD